MLVTIPLTMGRDAFHHGVLLSVGQGATGIRRISGILSVCDSFDRGDSSQHHRLWLIENRASLGSMTSFANLQNTTLAADAIS